MFDLGASELLLTAIVAIVVIGPKDMPVALRMAGRWIAKMRKISAHFRSGIDAMVREAELEEMERKWREQNEAIMKASPQLPSMNPSSADMQAPVASAVPSEDLAVPTNTSQPTSSLLTSPKDMSQQSGLVPVGSGQFEDTQSEDIKNTRQAELHVPPPPP